MKNRTGMKIAQKYVAGIEEIYSDMDGVWAYAAAGYYFEAMDAHTAHENNQKDLYKVIQTLTPCECKECESMKAADNETAAAATEDVAVDEEEAAAADEEVEAEDVADNEAADVADNEAADAVSEAEQFIEDHVEIVFVTEDDEAADSEPLERPMPLYDEDINSTDISVWIGSIGAYNGGDLVGMWISLPKTDDELDEIRLRVNTAATLVTLESQEEIEIMDINVNLEGFTEYVRSKGLSELNDIAQELEDMDDYDKDNLPAIAEVTGDIKQAIESAADAIILDDVNNDKELGEALNEHGFLTVEIPSHLENYIDFESIGRDYRLDGAFTITDAGQAVNLM